MKLLAKLTLMSLGVSAIPLAISGYFSSRIGQTALRGAIEEHALTVARQMAEYVASDLDRRLEILRTDARIFDLARSGDQAPTPLGVTKFLQFVYHQSADFVAVGMFDDHGEPVAEPAYLENPAAYETFRDHEPMTAKEVQSLALQAPLGTAMRTGEGIGPLFLAGPRRTPQVVLAVAFDPRLGGGKRVLCVQVSLRRLAEHVASISTNDSDVQLLDERSRLIAAGSKGGVGQLELKRLPSAAEGALPAAQFVNAYSSGGRRVLGAYAPATPYPFGVVVETHEEAAFFPVNRIRWATLFWIGVSGLVAALVAGALARSLSGRVAVLAEGSRAIAGGNLETRLAVVSSDELGDLAATFNAMATSLDEARGKIVQQNEEIRSWNESLERRVDEKTRELRQAQDLLLRSRALAAVGELGAGVAHEINNPLTGVLGLAQLLLMELPADHPARPMVQDIEDQGLRIRKIVSNLLRLAQRQTGEARRAIDVSRVMEDAIELCGPTELQRASVHVVRQFAPHAPLVRANPLQLQEAFIQLIQNARGAMPTGGTLTLETTVPDAKLVRVSIADTGRGIKAEHLPRIFDPFFTTKTEWAGTGMGLSVVHKIVEDHGGTIRVQSEEGRGTTFWLTFPADGGTAHLT